MVVKQPPVMRPRKQAKAASEDGDIQKVGNNKYVVDQSVLDEILANPEKLYTQVRVTPHKDQDGNIDGYRMTGIRRKSLTNSASKMETLYTASMVRLSTVFLLLWMRTIRSEIPRDFNFDVTRRKNKQTFEYEVR